MPDRISRATLARIFDPTIGDKLRLADTDLIIEVEKDFTIDGEELKFASGEVIRDGTGQSRITGARDGVDTVITGALIVDHWGIVKADVGITDGTIAGIGKAGNPDVEPGVDIIIGPGTEMIAGKGKILTAGAIDMHIHFIAPQPIDEALASGVTTMLGGGTDPATGTKAGARTPGARQIGGMIRAAHGFPMNLAFAGNGNAGPPAVLEEQVLAGAAALQLDGNRGMTPAAIDACLTVADALDVQALIHTDTLNESAFVENTIAAIKDRAIHATHTEGTGGGSAPDIIKVCGFSNVLPSSTNSTRPFTVNTIDEHLDPLMVRRRLDPSIAEDVGLTGNRIRKEIIAAEDILHDIGALSMIASDSHAMDRVGEVIIRTFQTAHQMKVQRGRLPEDSGDNDNFRVKRYIAKVTINPAITHGVDEWVGSIEIGKLADLVLWQPAFFGVRPDLVIKLGSIAAAPMGDANASNPTARPYHPMVGAFDKAVTFVSRAALDDGLADKLGSDRPLYPVHNTRAGISKESMIHNAARPKIEIDPKTSEVRADGELLACTPAEVLPMAQRYFLF